MGAGLANIHENGIDAEFDDLQAELDDPAGDALLAAIASAPPRAPRGTFAPPTDHPGGES